jgi:hypothetical protein
MLYFLVKLVLLSHLPYGACKSIRSLTTLQSMPTRRGLHMTAEKRQQSEGTLPYEGQARNYESEKRSNRGFSHMVDSLEKVR